MIENQLRTAEAVGQGWWVEVRGIELGLNKEGKPHVKCRGSDRMGGSEIEILRKLRGSEAVSF